MAKQTIQDQLRGLLEGNDEALELVEALVDEIVDLKQEVKDVEGERDELQTELDETPQTTTVSLGLDTLHYRLEEGNLRIQQQLENWINSVKQQNSAGVMLP